MSLDFWIKAAQLIVSLSLLVFIHELGHFMWAKIFHTRVDKFYLFFNPNFSIFRAKKINGKWHCKWFAKNEETLMMPLVKDGTEILDKHGQPIMVPAPTDNLDDNDWRKYPESTEWGIGWVPLGGYCKIAGMIDESMDPTVINTPAQSWEYRSKPAWQRLLIIVGGVLNNFVGALIIYSMMMYAYGEEYLPLQNAYLGYDYCELAEQCGFQSGDVITAVNGEEVVTDRDVLEKIVIEGKENVTIQRNGKTINITMPKNFGEQFIEKKETNFMTLRAPFVVGEVAPNTGASQAGLAADDSIVAVNGFNMNTIAEVREMIQNNTADTIDLTIVRSGEQLTVPVYVSEEGSIGIMAKNPWIYFKTERKEYGFFASFPAGISRGFNVLGSYVKQFRLVFTKAGAKSLGGFGAIGNLFPSRWDWSIFWNMTAFLSIILAFMNILPIPVLDGGYVLFIIYEMIARRKPSDKFMEISLNIGMFLLLALLIFANGNDLYRWIMSLLGK